MRNTLTALLFSATFAASAMPIAVERGVVVQGGLHFTKTIVLDQTMKTEGGGILAKGSYEVRFESLPGNKVHATFFQGNVKRGEADGTVAVRNHAAVDPGPINHGAAAQVSFSDLGLGPQSHAACFPPIGTLKVGVEGGNQILIGLLLPAVQKGGIAGAADLGAQKVQPAK
jgi:hypothetical protein